MNLTTRIASAWRALTGQRGDPYAATYGHGSGGGFAGASISRLTASLSAWSASINADLDGSLVILRARARALAANSEFGKRFLGLVESNVVGRCHPKLQVRVMRPAGGNKPPGLSKSINDAVETHWQRWGRTADITGRHRDLSALLRTAVKGVARDGEALIRKVRDRKLPYGMALQLLEADRLDETYNLTLDNGHTVRQGVEMDSRGLAVAYYLKTRHPGENYAVTANTLERVPAGDLIHLFLPERAEQVRGVTWMHAVVIRASVIQRFEEAAVLAAEVGASKIAAISRSEDAGDATLTMADGTHDGTRGGIPQMKVEAGEMFELPPGYTLSSWNPEYPHANFESFLKACLRGVAAGLGVAAHNLTGDMTDVNYSSARIAELAEREVWMTLQEWLVGSAVQPIFEEWLATGLLLNQITFINDNAPLNADRYDQIRYASRFQGRRWEWVDPAKDANANATLLANQLTSRTRIAAEQGIEFDDILDELAQEADAIKAAGLTPEPATPAPEPTPAPVRADVALASAIDALGRAATREPVQTPAPVAPVHVSVALDAEHLREAAQGIHATLAAQGAELAAQIREDIQAMPIVIPAPVVNVAAPNVTVENRVEPTPVTLEASLPAPEIVVSLPARRQTVKVTKDEFGEITGSESIERDA